MLLIRTTAVLLLFFSTQAFSFGDPHLSPQEVRVRIESESPGYVYVPVNVPEGCESIAVEINYPKEDGANRIEVGIFDDRFESPDSTAGFRGWSGSVRKGFFLTRQKATHGYVPGKIGQGVWRLILGAASVKSGGVEVELKITFDHVPDPLLRDYNEEVSRSFRPASGNKSAARWKRGDLHAHTYHSDGRWSVEALLNAARTNGLDFIAVTDHNTFSHHAEIDRLSKRFPGMLILRGEEVTTYGGHINVWGLRIGDLIDFRLAPGERTSVERLLGSVHSRGLLASINHPTMGCKGCSWSFGDWIGFDSVEVWNAAWDEEDERALAKWGRMLVDGKRITAIGSSDTHQPPYEVSPYPTNRLPGSPTLFLKDASSVEGLFRSITEGSAYVAEGPGIGVEFSAGTASGPGDTAKVPGSGTLECSVRIDGAKAGSILKVIARSGSTDEFRTMRVRDGKTERIKLTSRAVGFVRLEVRNPDGTMAAFTNPIWIE